MPLATKISTKKNGKTIVILKSNAYKGVGYSPANAYCKLSVLSETCIQISDRYYY